MKALFYSTLLITYSLTACQRDDVSLLPPITIEEAVWQEGETVEDLEQQLARDLAPDELLFGLDTLKSDQELSRTRRRSRIRGKVILDYQFEASLPSVRRVSSLQRISGRAFYFSSLKYTLQYGIFDTGWKTYPSGFQVRMIVHTRYSQRRDWPRTIPVRYTVQGKPYTVQVPASAQIVITEYARKGSLSKRHLFVFNQIPNEPLSFWRSYANRDDRPTFCLTNANTHYLKYPGGSKDKLLAQWQVVRP